ncbi:hypothetical protein [Rhodococcus sp. T2V]|uniref:hypothetical protein n=1 Tax=Rhodococcus sp. T2V TaxID=3034164 RepID=UPI0023E2CFAB|nr:hypothetical protein [Rhodococcus sp. T2V]
MSNTIILDSVFDPFDVTRTRVIYAELAIPGDPGFDDLASIRRGRGQGQSEHVPLSSTPSHTPGGT